MWLPPPFHYWILSPTQCSREEKEISLKKIKLLFAGDVIVYVKIQKTLKIKLIHEYHFVKIDQVVTLMIFFSDIYYTSIQSL